MSMSNPSSWTDFRDNTGKLKIEQDDIMVSEGPGGPMMKLSPKLKEQLHKPWTNALILKNMSRYFVAHFQKKEDLDFVLTSGPWVIMNQYLVVQRWKPNFVPGEDSIQSMPIWVRLSKLSMEWMVSELLWNIGGLLGRMCKGHSMENCREGVVGPIHEDNTCDTHANKDKEASPYGQWLLVSYGKHGNRNFKGKPRKSGQGDSRASGSRFEIMNDVMEVNMNEGSFQSIGNNYGGIVIDGHKPKEKSVLVEVTNINASPIAKARKGTKKIVKKSDKLSTKKTVFQGDAGASSGNMGTKGKYQAQPSSVQEIDCERQDNASVPRQFHKEVKDFETKYSAVADGSIVQETLIKNGLQNENNF
ncbi:hypothetical protein Dsin_002045 [Dipteronia sinensis]|uniref:DUF4283 domain-containing protein n=1 Tax=Dipteronia sinensis TaxID=43782 RepID=A0AAE0B6S1_9ROSI|nr:hypothetical protein Dsin_002045 [Dipteronia sinensis]